MGDLFREFPLGKERGKSSPDHGTREIEVLLSSRAKRCMGLRDKHRGALSLVDIHHS